MRSSLRAFLSNVGSGGIGQGGSTITQQLIKNRYFTNPKRDLDRKVREAILAARLTGEWSKRRILQEYLNTVYFGPTRTASRPPSQRIIGTPLDQLDLGDAALLAGLIKDPINFDPFTHPDAAIAAPRATVLRGDASTRRRSPRPRRRSRRRSRCRRGPTAPSRRTIPKCLLLEPHSLYAEEVKNRLLELKELGPDEKAAEKRVFAGGLRVYTAYQPDLQAKAQAAVDSTVGRFAPFQASMAVMDPRTGDVPAIVSGTGRDYRGLDLATMGPLIPDSGRAVGSTFKAITLATAIANGYSPKDTVNGGAPCTIKYAEGTPGPARLLPVVERRRGRTRRPQVHQRERRGRRHGRPLQPDEELGELRVPASAHQRRPAEGARHGDPARPHPPGRPLPLDRHRRDASTHRSRWPRSTARSPTTASGTTRCSSPASRTARGASSTAAPGGKRVLHPQVARTVTDVLSHVTEGTAPKAKLADRPMAGKTGTRDNSDDAWFAGLHAAAGRGRLDGRSGELAARDDERRRHPGLRRDLPGDHVAEVHDVGAHRASR